MTVHRPTDRPPERPSIHGQAYQCKVTQSTGMATQMQLEVILAGNLHSHRRLVKQKQLKESIKTTTESGNCFCIRVV